MLTIDDRQTGDVLGLIAFTDGSVGIARNGQPIDGMHWQDGQMKECVHELLRLSGRDQE